MYSRFQSASILVYHHWDCVLVHYGRVWPPHVQYKYFFTDLSDPLHVRPSRACNTAMACDRHTETRPEPQPRDDHVGACIVHEDRRRRFVCD